MAKPDVAAEPLRVDRNRVGLNEDDIHDVPVNDDRDDRDDSDYVGESESEPAATDEKPTGRGTSVRTALAVGVAVALALMTIAGWFGWRAHQAQARAELNDTFVQVGRQAAINLTTIDYRTVDADVTRIIESSTGTFYEDFQQRSGPFIDVVKKARSKSEGAVTQAGLESVNGDEAQVLVAVTVRTTMNDQPQPEPRGWRMRIGVVKTGDDVKVSNVEFVP